MAKTPGAGELSKAGEGQIIRGADLADDKGAEATAIVSDPRAPKIVYRRHRIMAAIVAGFNGGHIPLRPMENGHAKVLSVYIPGGEVAEVDLDQSQMAWLEPKGRPKNRHFKIKDIEGKGPGRPPSQYKPPKLGFDPKDFDKTVFEKGDSGAEDRGGGA